MSLMAQEQASSDFYTTISKIESLLGVRFVSASIKEGLALPEDFYTIISKIENLLDARFVSGNKKAEISFLINGLLEYIIKSDFIKKITAINWETLDASNVIMEMLNGLTWLSGPLAISPSIDPGTLYFYKIYDAFTDNSHRLFIKGIYQVHTAIKYYIIMADSKKIKIAEMPEYKWIEHKHNAIMQLLDDLETKAKNAGIDLKINSRTGVILPAGNDEYHEYYYFFDQSDAVEISKNIGLSSIFDKIIAALQFVVNQDSVYYYSIHKKLSPNEIAKKYISEIETAKDKKELNLIYNKWNETLLYSPMSTLYTRLVTTKFETKLDQFE